MSAVTLLIHGGGLGAWSWKPVIPLLANAGVPTRAFDLPGAGSDPTPIAQVTLADVSNRIVESIEDLEADEPIRIVAHSLSAVGLPAAIATCPDQVGDVVLLAGVAVPSGQAAIDWIPQPRRDRYREEAKQSPDNALIPQFEDVRTRFFSGLSDRQAKAAFNQLRPQPFATYSDVVAVSWDKLDVPVRYIAFADDQNFSAEVSAGFAGVPGAKVETIAGDHCGMLSNPEALAAALS